jgi:hypothetical protein
MGRGLRISRWTAWPGAAAIAALVAVAAADRTLPTADDPAGRHTYFSNGVHNDLGCPTASSCVYPRKPGEPQRDPKFPAFWISEWKMYRVFRKFTELPPPYASPPVGMSPADYEVSDGSSYYDATYVPPDQDGTGAMLEYYEKRCLPIFPGSNEFSCSFVSLGNKAYFLRYDDRPAGTPECCQFSLDNHPPRTDFVKHLPYNPAQSKHLGGTIQAYSILVPAGPASILFGYAFEKQARPDIYDKTAGPYQHPQSFFFSGATTVPPDAPIVSQNYINFRMQKPDPAKTWAQVTQKCPAQPEWCCLFESDCPASLPPSSPSPRATGKRAGWSTLQPPSGAHGARHELPR